MSGSDGLCELDFPAPGEIARLAENAQAGRREAFVGTGDPDMQLSCQHGSWRLGDVLDSLTAPPAACTETTKAGDPCKGTPGDDGLCAAHKRKDSSDAEVEVAVDADPQAEKGGKAEEGDG